MAHKVLSRVALRDWIQPKKKKKKSNWNLQPLSTLRFLDGGLLPDLSVRGFTTANYIKSIGKSNVLPDTTVCIYTSLGVEARGGRWSAPPTGWQSNPAPLRSDVVTLF